jgi:putative SOS response-associated peptidase YedK
MAVHEKGRAVAWLASDGQTKASAIFTMLTTPPGPDIAPYHDRQLAILDRADWPHGSIHRFQRRRS